MMLHLPQVLSAAQVAQCRAWLDAAQWTSGAATAGAQASLVKQNLQLPDASAAAVQAGQFIQDALARYPLFISAALPLRVLPPKFNRYEGQGHYGDHVDGAVMHGPSGQALRTDLSCTLFLCEPDDYEGGELIVSDTYGTHEVKLPAGDLILYPSSSVHRVEPVSSGVRICSFFWVQSMVRDDGQRASLYELDSAIQSLRQTVGDHEAVVRLTHHYHNLLRRWADV